MNISILNNICKCSCGAVTFEYRGDSYSCSEEYFLKHFPNEELPGEVQFYSCNRCINNWGLDLCGCGSGEPFGECEEDLLECSEPAQVLGEKESCCCKGGWL